MGNITRKQVDEERKEMFSAEYQAAASDEDVLGVMVARYLKWDGYAILRTLGFALEDANFHKVYAELQAKYPEAFEE